MAQYRKKPVVVEAIQYFREKNIMQVQDFFGDGNGRELIYSPDLNDYYIKTLEGDMYLSVGDWIIKGVKGEFYPCKPDIFAATYELADGESDLTLAVGLLERWAKLAPVGHIICDDTAAFLEKMRGR